MNKISTLVTVSFLVAHFGLYAKDNVNLFCEVYTAEGLKSIPLDEQMEADKDDDGTYRVDEEEYGYAVDRCDRHNIHSGKILPSIIAKIGSYVFPLGSKFRKEKYKKAKVEAARAARDPEKTMVIFFHGTGSNPIDDINSPAFPSYEEDRGGGELLSFLQKRMKNNGAEEGLDYIALHGPGSGNLQVTNYHTKFMSKDAYSWTAGSALGSGSSENVENAMLHLKGVTNNPALEDIMAKHAQSIKSVGKLIVLGWSRGSVTAIQFARDLYHDPELKDIAVHLFVVDPVPGMGNITFGMWKNIFHIYPNVKSYFGAYAQDERSVGFTPLVPRISDSTDLFSSKRKAMVIAEFPGNHGTLVGNTWNQKTRTESARTIESFGALARIVRGLAQSFVVSNGGHMSGVEYHAGHAPMAMAEISESMLQDFEIVHADMAQFNALQNEGYLGNQVQKLGKDRKYHQDWNVFGNFKMLNDIVQPLMPRYTAKNIPGFKNKYNFKKDGERRWVNHLHKVLAQEFVSHGRFDINEFFNPNYYKTYKKMIKADI